MKKTIQGNFEGYIWWSNECEPQLCQACEATVLELDDEQNPFVAEALLWDKAQMKSISIHFVDGEYQVGEVQVTPEDFKNEERATEKEFLPLRLSGVSKLRFLQYWDAIPDALCEGFETLQPGNLVFVGFKTEEKQP